ncbi:MAG: HD domain-containing protein [bacterium]|nr:HD domain-containing protein [bacterium]
MDKIQASATDLYVITIDHKDGRTDSPVFIERHLPDCDEQLGDAMFYFRRQFKNAGMISVSLGRDLCEAGVANAASIRPWQTYRDETLNLDENNRRDKILKQLQNLGVSSTVIEALKEDLCPEENENLFIKLVDQYITDADENEQIKKALSISKKAHEGATQKRPQDADGPDFIPYVNHPIRIATMALRDLQLSPAIIEAALLHDVVEDTTVTFEDLARDFDSPVIEILRDVTRRKDETRDAYMTRTKELHGVSKLLKSLDRFHNLLRSFTIKDVTYLERYIAESKDVYLPEFLHNPVLSEFALFFNHLLDELEKYKEKLKTKPSR